MSDPEPPPMWWEFYAPEFPDWHAWEGVNGLLYARRPRSSPAKVARAWTADGLAARVRELGGL